jgi:hypothetical protein
MIFSNFLKRAAYVGSSLLLASAAWSQPHPDLANCTILIVRHAEKPERGPDLTPQGEARAKAYVNYFTHLKIDGKPWHTTHLFAAADSKDSHRPRLTMTPLSAAIGMPLDTRFGSKDVTELAQDVQTHRYGHDVLICWRHGKIPDLVTALGADPTPLFHGEKWPADVYDWVVELPFDGSGKIRTQDVKLIHEHLLPTDSK